MLGNTICKQPLLIDCWIFSTPPTWSGCQWETKMWSKVACCSFNTDWSKSKYSGTCPSPVSSSILLYVKRVLNFTQKQMLAYWHWPFSGSNQICVSSLESKRAWIATYLIIFKLYYTTMWKINERQRWRNRMMFLMCDQTSLRWGIHINLWIQNYLKYE